jgi:hypothetical protein
MQQDAVFDYVIIRLFAGRFVWRLQDRKRLFQVGMNGTP